MTATADILSRAADLLDREGWIQGIQRTSTRVWDGCRMREVIKRCVWGAIVDSSPALGDRWLAAEALRRLVGMPVIDWNDADGRRQEQITSALRACALLERAKHESSSTPSQPTPSQVCLMTEPA